MKVFIYQAPSRADTVDSPVQKGANSWINWIFFLDSGSEQVREERKERLGLAGTTAPSNDGWESVSGQGRSSLQPRECVRMIQRKQLSSQ